jgi:hypothetical protein
MVYGKTNLQGEAIFWKHDNGHERCGGFVLGNKVPLAAIGILMAMAGLGFSGCSNQGGPPPYGVVEGWQQFTSRNGLGVHRRLWEHSGARCVAPQRLSSRLNQVDVIVLIPRTFDPPSQQARQWLEQWLKASPGRSVVYFGRDFNADEYFYEQILEQLPNEQQSVARQRLAELRVGEFQAMLESYSESTFCEWFYLDVGQGAQRLILSDEGIAEGGSRNGLSFESPTALASSDRAVAGQAEWPVRSRLLAPDVRWRDQPPSWITEPVEANPVKPLALPWSSDEDKLIVRSRWKPEELDTLEVWNAAFDQMLQSEVLVSSDHEEPLIFRLTDAERLGEGQILIVANGAPFLNASIVQPWFFQLSEFIVQQCLPARRVALLAYDFQGLQISYVDEADERGAGLEMFLQWPLSAIMMPAALVGLIAFASLLPILGRPRKLAQETVSDFGLHVEAIGQMLHQAEDEDFAKKVVADYFRCVRGEHPPSWLERDPPPK